jgi:hypothetical protein
LASAAETGRLVVNPIIYAEVSIHFRRIEDLGLALPRDRFIREPTPVCGGVSGREGISALSQAGRTASFAAS